MAQLNLDAPEYPISAEAPATTFKAYLSHASAWQGAGKKVHLASKADLGGLLPTILMVNVNSPGSQLRSSAKTAGRIAPSDGSACRLRLWAGVMRLGLPEAEDTPDVPPGLALPASFTTWRAERHTAARMQAMEGFNWPPLSTASCSNPCSVNETSQMRML